MPRAASASALLRMAAFTWAERAHGSAAWTSCKGDVRGKVGSRLEWCFSQCGGRACDHALSWSSPRPPSPTASFSSLVARAYATRDEAPTSRVCLSRRRTRILGTHFGSPVARRAACFVAT